jgi:hypothetical protein
MLINDDSRRRAHAFRAMSPPSPAPSPTPVVRRDDVIVPRHARVSLIEFPGYVTADGVRDVERMCGGRRALARVCFPRESARRARAADAGAGVDDDNGDDDADARLGAEDAAARRTKGRLELRFRAPFESTDDDGVETTSTSNRAHAVYGERRETRSVVLKLSQFSSSDGATVLRTDVSAVGVARRTFAFRGACDFVSVSSAASARAGDDDIENMRSTHLTAADAVMVKEAKGPASDPFELAIEAEPGVGGQLTASLKPPLFTRDDIPVRDYFAQHDTGAKTTRDVDFHEIAVPAQGVGVDGSESAMRALDRLLEQRPIWAPAAALAAMPNALADEVIIKRLHVTKMYTFSSGPYKKQWVAVGVDPRFDRKYLPYQTVTVRFPGEWFRDDDERGVKRKANAACSHSNADHHRLMHTFRAFPDTRHASFVLADLALPSVRAIIDTALAADAPSTPTACDERRGWLSPALHRKVQHAIVRGFQSLMDDQDPIANDEAFAGIDHEDFHHELDEDDADEDDAEMLPDADIDAAAADTAAGVYEILGGGDSDGDPYE